MILIPEFKKLLTRFDSIVTLYIRGTTASGDALTSKLHLVDLAGSERLDKTGATGDRLTEAKATSASLGSPIGIDREEA